MSLYLQSAVLVIFTGRWCFDLVRFLANHIAQISDQVKNLKLKYFEKASQYCKLNICNHVGVNVF